MESGWENDKERADAAETAEGFVRALCCRRRVVRSGCAGPVGGAPSRRKAVRGAV